MLEEPAAQDVVAPYIEQDLLHSKTIQVEKPVCLLGHMPQSGAAQGEGDVKHACAEGHWGYLIQNDDAGVENCDAETEAADDLLQSYFTVEAAASAEAEDSFETDESVRLDVVRYPASHQGGAHEKGNVLSINGIETCFAADGDYVTEDADAASSGAPPSVNSLGSSLNTSSLGPSPSAGSLCSDAQREGNLDVYAARVDGTTDLPTGSGKYDADLAGKDGKCDMHTQQTYPVAVVEVVEYARDAHRLDKNVDIKTGSLHKGTGLSATEVRDINVQKTRDGMLRSEARDVVDIGTSNQSGMSFIEEADAHRKERERVLCMRKAERHRRQRLQEETDRIAREEEEMKQITRRIERMELSKRRERREKEAALEDTGFLIRSAGVQGPTCADHTVLVPNVNAESTIPANGFPAPRYVQTGCSPDMHADKDVGGLSMSPGRFDSREARSSSASQCWRADASYEGRGAYEGRGSPDSGYSSSRSSSLRESVSPTPSKVFCIPDSGPDPDPNLNQIT